MNELTVETLVTTEALEMVQRRQPKFLSAFKYLSDRKKKNKKQNKQHRFSLVLTHQNVML